jgi:hypothetical protein
MYAATAAATEINKIDTDGSVLANGSIFRRRNNEDHASKKASRQKNKSGTF